MSCVHAPPDKVASIFLGTGCWNAALRSWQRNAHLTERGKGNEAILLIFNEKELLATIVKLSSFLPASFLH